MSLDELLDSLPVYAKDLKLNYSSLVSQNSELTPQQLWGTLLASAIAIRNSELTKAIQEKAAAQLSPQAYEAACAAAAIMGMNNIYYRFLHLTTNENYSTMPARLRMNVLRTHGVDHNDFELWSLAVSAINGCGRCVDSHEKVLRDRGVKEETVLAVIRLASVLHAIGPVLEAEQAAERSSATA